MPKKSLILLDDYKAYKGINSDKDDTRTSAIIGSVSSFVKQYCGRTFIDYTTSAKTEYINGTGKTSFFLAEFPILEAPIIYTSLNAQTDKNLLLEGTGYYVDYDTGEIVNAYGMCFPGGFHSVQVVYKGGMLDISEDLKLACLDLVSYYLNKEYKPKQTTGSAISENFSSGELPSRIPNHIKNTLDLYKI